MEDFLKKFSNVPNEFIEDFFNIANEKFNDNDILIDFNKVIEWLDVRKDNLKRLLIKYFSEKFDYKIKSVKKYNKNNHGSNYIEIITITPDCFKELCMLSQTAKAKEVRKYYLSVEKLIKKYHHHIEEQLYKKIGLLEKNQKPKINIKGGVIYFFEALNNIKLDDLEKDLYKLGKTSNKKNRFKTYNSGNANDIEPLFILEVNDIDKVEKCIKNLLTDYQYRKYKEIYQLDIDALKIVFSNCDDLVRGFKKYMDNNNPKTANKNFRKIRHADYGIILFFDKNKK